MQGKTRSKKTEDLPYIFFKIRETRCPKTRRSWQRRARLALAKHTGLTAAEKHEICCVWSRSESYKIDSPAMSKLFKREHKPQPHQTISARSCTRRAFDVGVKKPSNRGLVAANDDVFSSICSFSRTGQRELCAPQHPQIYRYRDAVFQVVFPQSSGYIYPHFHRGSDAPQLLYCGSRSNPSRPYERTPSYAPPAPPLQLKFSPCETPIKFGLNETVTANLRFWLTRNAASSEILRSSNDFEFENCGNWS